MGPKAGLLLIQHNKAIHFKCAIQRLVTFVNIMSHQHTPTQSIHTSESSLWSPPSVSVPLSMTPGHGWSLLPWAHRVFFSRIWMTRNCVLCTLLSSMESARWVHVLYITKLILFFFFELYSAYMNDKAYGILVFSQYSPTETYLFKCCISYFSCCCYEPPNKRGLNRERVLDLQ